MKSTCPKPVINIDLGPMSERFHTGIANVAKFLAIEMLGDADIECMFTFNRQTLPQAAVEKLTQLSGGEILWWIAGRTLSAPNPAEMLDRRVIGIYPGHKWHRRFFPFEVQIVHDLTTVLTPQHHTRETIEFWQSSLFGDIASSDLIAAVSNSTALDIRTYFPELSHIPLVVSRLAACGSEVIVKAPVRQRYLVVLGTLEPRKNVLPVLEFLAANPAMFERAGFVFVGRIGWGDPIEPHLERLKLRPWMESGHLRLTGFIGDEERDHLLAHSCGLIYPSVYEGFGLPVLEALAQGVPAVTTTSSSLPEVGGSHAIYCDFSDPAEIGAALERILLPVDPHKSADDAAARKAWAAAFSWTQTYRRIRDAALAEYDRKHSASAAAQSPINTVHG